MQKLYRYFLIAYAADTLTYTHACMNNKFHKTNIIHNENERIRVYVINDNCEKKKQK